MRGRGIRGEDPLEACLEIERGRRDERVSARANGRAAAALLLAAVVVLGGLVYRLFTTG